MNKKQPESKKQPDADFSWVDDYEERPASKQPPSQPTGEEAEAEDLFAAPGLLASQCLPFPRGRFFLNLLCIF